MYWIILDDHAIIRFNVNVGLVSLLVFGINGLFIIAFRRIIFYVAGIVSLINGYVLAVRRARLGFCLFKAGQCRCSYIMILHSSIKTLIMPFYHGKILFSLISMLYLDLMIDIMMIDIKDLSDNYVLLN